jgi:hypothetical protein
MWDIFRFAPKPFWFARFMLTGVLPVQPKPHRRRPEAYPRPRRCSSAPESPLEVSNPHALISLVTALLSA